MYYSLISSMKKSSYDADAQAFITAAAITNATQQTAINTLVISLKNYGIWNKMKALYPIVGGTASSHKFNLKDPRDLDVAFRLTFNGGFTHTNSGVLGNGSNGWVQTYLNTRTELIPSNVSFGFYTNTNKIANTKIVYGNSDNQTTYIPLTQCYLRTPSNTFVNDIGDFNYSRIQFTNNTTAGYYITSKTATNLMKVFKNNTLMGTTTVNDITNLLPNSNIVISAFNASGNITNYESVNFEFFNIGSGLTDTEAANLYSSVQAFQITLGRQV